MLSRISELCIDEKARISLGKHLHTKSFETEGLNSHVKFKHPWNQISYRIASLLSCCFPYMREKGA